MLPSVYYTVLVSRARCLHLETFFSTTLRSRHLQYLVGPHGTKPNRRQLSLASSATTTAVYAAAAVVGDGAAATYATQQDFSTYTHDTLLSSPI